MKLKHIVLSLSVCATLLGAQAAFADAASDAKKAVQAQYNKANAAAGKNDVKGMLSICAPDYKSADMSGNIMTLEALRNQLPQVFQMFKNVKATTTIQKFVLKGKTAQVTMQERIQANATTQQGKVSKILIQAGFQDLWVNNGKTWLRKGTKALTSSMSVDGKPIPEGGPR